MKPSTTDLTRLAWSAALSGLLPGLACAQSAASPSPSSADDTVMLSPFTVDASSDRGYYSPQSVSGTRTRTELINLPMNLSVFNDQFIEDIAARDLLDVVVYAAGVSQGTGGGSDTSNGDTLGFTLRGQAGFVPYRNGFRRLRVVDPATIERVEVVKGPSSVLYGFAFPGGMVNYITKRPVQRQVANASVRVGSYDFYKGTVDVNVPAVNDTLAVRMIASYEEAGNWADRHKSNTIALYPSVTWWVTPKTTVTLEYESTRRDTESPRSGLPFNATRYLLDEGFPIDHSWNSRAPGDFLNVDMTAYTAELVHRFNDAFTVRGNWTKSIWQDDALTNTTPLAYNATTGIMNGARGYSRGSRGSWDEYIQLELVNNFSFAGIDVQNIVGYQHGEEEFRQTLATRPPPLDDIRWNLRDRSTWILSRGDPSLSPGLANNHGNFAQNTLNTLYLTNQLAFLEGRLRTLAGYRIDRLREDSLVDANTANPKRSTSWAEPSKTPQLGVLYKIMDGLSVYGQYSESLVNLYTGVQRGPDGNFYVPVPGSGEGWDVGVKAELLEGRIAGNVSVYRVENQNIIRNLPSVTLPDGTSFTPTQQSGTDRSDGFEMDLRLRPLKDTQLVFAYAYTDAYVLSDVQAAAVINGVRMLTREGHRLSNAPEHTVSVWLRQNLGSFGRIENTYVAGGYRYVSDRAFTEAYNVVNNALVPPPDMPSYSLCNVSVGGSVKFGETTYRAALSVKNLFDKTYLQQRFAFGAPRTFEFSLSASF